jgi:hypothetical protein
MSVQDKDDSMPTGHDNPDTMPGRPLPGRSRPAPLSKLRPYGRVVRCLPGLCEPYGVTPPGETERCRHCETLLPREDETHAR